MAPGDLLLRIIGGSEQYVRFASPLTSPLIEEGGHRSLFLGRHEGPPPGSPPPFVIPWSPSFSLSSFLDAVSYCGFLPPPAHEVRVVFPSVASP